jgi:NTP pyrophosphatase (non-canonical NTP hydrolase)
MMISQLHEQMLTEVQRLIHGAAVDAGWHTDLKTGERKHRNFGEAIALMHSELSEALESYRKNTMDDHLPHRSGVEVELADAVIRIFDTAGAEGLDLAGAIREKVEYNRNRADHKIENRIKEGGKKI